MIGYLQENFSAVEVLMKVAEILQVGCLQTAKARIVAGRLGVDHEVHWVHVVEVPDPLPWVRENQFVLTTGYTWPRDSFAQRQLIRDLAERTIAGIGMAVPQFFDRFPTAMLEEADATGLPLIEIPWELPFSQITEDVHRAILAEQFCWRNEADAVHKQLTKAAIEARKLSDLIRTLGELLQQGVIVQSWTGELLARYERGALNDFSETDSRYDWLTLDISDTSGTDVGSVLFSNGDDIDAPRRLAYPVRSQTEDYGVLWIIEEGRPLGDLDLRVAEHAAVIIALFITHQRELSLNNTKLGSALLHSILEGKFEETPVALERVRLLGVDLKAHYQLGLLHLDMQVPLNEKSVRRRERLVETLRFRLTSLMKSPLISTTLNRIVFVLPAGVDAEVFWAAFQAEESVGMVVSRAHQGIKGIQECYRELSAISDYVVSGTVISYHHLLLPRVFEGDHEAQNDLIQQTLGPLINKRPDALLLTLRILIKNGFKLNPTAKDMDVHISTLRYRLNRIEEKTGLDLSSPEVRFRLEVAMWLRNRPTIRQAMKQQPVVM